MPRISAEDRVYDNLISLKRHLRSCKQCTAARKSNTPHDMCGGGMLLVLRAAEGYDSIIRLRVAAHSHPQGFVFACPDLRKHGKSFALTASALLVQGVQDSLI